MTTNDDKALLVLNLLIQAGKDAEQGFQTAAQCVNDAALARLFHDYATQRGKFIAELQDRVRTLRSDIPATGSAGAALHRQWMDLKAANERDQIHALLTECERGEDIAVMAYRDALKERDVDAQTRALIQRQYEQVQAAHDRVKQLRDSATYAYR